MTVDFRFLYSPYFPMSAMPRLRKEVPVLFVFGCLVAGVTLLRKTCEEFLLFRREDTPVLHSRDNRGRRHRDPARIR